MSDAAQPDRQPETPPSQPTPPAAEAPEPGVAAPHVPPAPQPSNPPPPPHWAPPAGFSPGSAPHHPAPGYPVYQPPMNTYAILSLVLGLFVLPPLGIYFGYEARKQIAVTGERGAELATAGIVVGWTLTALIAAFILLWCAIMSVGFLPLLLFPAIATG